MATYAWFSLWLLLTIFVGLGVYALLAKLIKPKWVNVLLLPGTLVSEGAYIIGCLITGGEIRRAKIMPESSADGGQPTTEAQSKLGFFSPLVASTLAIVACGSAILAANSYMGKSVVAQYGSVGQREAMLPPKGNFTAVMPGKQATDCVWDMLHTQVQLLKRSYDVLSELKWKDWRVPLFVYLSLCLGVRLSVATRPVRTTLAAVVLVAIGIALTGVLWTKFNDLIDTLWPLLSYVWGLLLLSLVLVLLISGIVALMKALAGKTAK